MACAEDAPPATAACGGRIGRWLRTYDAFQLHAAICEAALPARVAAAWIGIAAALPISMLVERPAFAASDASAPVATSSSSVESPASAASRAHPLRRRMHRRVRRRPSPRLPHHTRIPWSLPARRRAHRVHRAHPQLPPPHLHRPLPLRPPAKPSHPHRRRRASIRPCRPKRQNATAHAIDMRKRFTQEVTRRLNVPASEQRAYGERLQKALVDADLGDLAGEYVAMVDRAPNVRRCSSTSARRRPTHG